MKTIQWLFSAALLLTSTSFAGNDFSIRILEGPREPLLDLAFSPDGEFALGSTLNSGVWIWETETGDLTHTINENNELNTFDVSVSPGGQRFASGGSAIGGGSHIGIWDLVSGEEILRFDDAGEIESFKFSPDDNLFLSAGMNLDDDGFELEVRVWDAATGEHLFMRNLGDLFLLEKKYIDFTSDSSKIIVPTREGLIILDAQTGETLRQYSHSVSAARLTPNQQKLVAINSPGRFGENERILIWDFLSAESETPIESIEIEFDASDVFFHPNGETFLISPLFSGPVTVRDTETGNLVLELQKENGDPLRSSCAKFVAEGSIIVSSYQGKASLWNSTTGEKITDLPKHGDSNQDCNIKVTPDGNFAMTYLERSREDTTVRLIDLRERE